MRRLTMFATIAALAVTVGVPRVYAQRGGGHGMGAGPSMAAGERDRGGPMQGADHDHNLPSMESKNPDMVLSQNKNLSSKLESVLPAGTNLQQAASGFKNLGQFIAAAHVSHNLGIPFEDLKARMTGAHSVSLGKAIQELKPEANAKEEAKRANKAAQRDLSES